MALKIFLKTMCTTPTLGCGLLALSLAACSTAPRPALQPAILRAQSPAGVKVHQSPPLEPLAQPTGPADDPGLIWDQRLMSLPQQPIPDFDQIPAPPDNPVTQGKVELGFRLWFDPRLSANSRMTCGTCHHFKKGFSNAEPTAVGVVGKRGRRNVPTSYGSPYLRSSFWDGRARTLEEQALMPIQDPIEMNETLPRVIQKLSQLEYYQHKFQEVYGTGVTAEGIGKALASFQRALALEPTPYERFQAGDNTALSPEQQAGMQLFFGKARCSLCHRGVVFSDQQFVNTGIGMDKPQPDLGRHEVTGMEWDKGAFKTPTLLNIAKTAPYMHDGSISTLQEVIAHYNRGGVPNPQLDPRMRPLGLSEQEQAQLVAFMHAFSANDNLKALGKLPGIHLPKAELDALLAEIAASDTPPGSGSR